MFLGRGEAGALTVALVAQVDGGIVGHAAFSPVTMSDGTPDWYGVGSVLPTYQRRGIGKALMEEELAFMVLPLTGKGPRGTVTFHEAFAAKGAD